MAIHRELRRQLADDLAALMRREITLGQYNAQHAELEKHHGGEMGADPGAVYVNWVLVELDSTGKISVDEAAWRNMQRILAFLESDLEARWHEADYGWAVPPRITVALATLMIALVAACYAIMGMSLGLLISAWVSTGLVGTFGHELLSRQRRRREWPDTLGEYLESNWETYAHLLERFELPSYDQAIHRMPTAKRTTPKWFWVALSPVIAFGSLCMGPFSLLLGLSRVGRLYLVPVT